MKPGQRSPNLCQSIDEGRTSRSSVPLSARPRVAIIETGSRPPAPYSNGGIHLKRAVWLIVLLFPLALFAVACGGGDDDEGGTGGDNGAADSGNDNGSSGDNEAKDDSDDSKDDDGWGSSGDAMKGSPADRCPAIFSIDQVAALFGEDAVFEEDESSENESLGQLHCVWSTVEDPDDADDLKSQLLQVQVYSGDPIDGANFYNKDIFPGAEDVAGVGDEAFRVMNDYAISMAFVEGKVSAFMDLSVIDLGGGEPAVRERADQVSALFQQLHDRVAN